MRIHQLCARMEYGDAVSNHVLEIHRTLEEWNYESRVFAETRDEFGKNMAFPDAQYQEFINNRDDILIYHYSIYTPNIRLYKRSKNRKILIYHNITPPEFFEPYDTGVAGLLRLGREAIKDLNICDIAVGDSDFNRKELIDLGFKPERTFVLPIFVNYHRLIEKAEKYAKEKEHEDFRIIFVGRIVPNKKIEDLIRAFYYYKTCVNPLSSLVVVGASWIEKYDEELRWLVDSFRLSEAVQITGRVSEERLASIYASGNLFLSMSEHEGFCVPLVESMAFGIPILAYSSSAVTETLGGAGVIFREKIFPMIGEMIEIIREYPNLREKIVSAEKERLEHFSLESTRAKLKEIIEATTEC